MIFVFIILLLPNICNSLLLVNKIDPRLAYFPEDMIVPIIVVLKEPDVEAMMRGLFQICKTEKECHIVYTQEQAVRIAERYNITLVRVMGTVDMFSGKVLKRRIYEIAKDPFVEGVFYDLPILWSQYGIPIDKLDPREYRFIQYIKPAVFLVTARTIEPEEIAKNTLISQVWQMEGYGQGIKVGMVDTGVYPRMDLMPAIKGRWGVYGAWEDKMGHGCTTPDTLVLTSEGIVTMKDLYDRVNGEIITTRYPEGIYETKVLRKQLYVLSFDDESWKVEMARVLAVHRLRYKGKLYKITFGNATIYLTPWHPTYVFDGEKVIVKRAEELDVGDWLLLPLKTVWLSDERPTIAGVKLNEDLAWLIGYFIGDGSFIRARKYFSLSFYDSCYECIENANKILTKYFGLKGKIKREPGKKDYYIRVGFTKDSRLYKFLTSLGFSPGTKKYTVKIPEVITRSDLNIIGAFIAGLIDSDGSMNPSQPHFEYVTVSKELANELSFLLNSIGIRSVVTVKKPGIRKFPGHITQGTYAYRISVWGKSYLRKLYELSGRYIVDRKKAEVLAEYVKDEPRSFTGYRVPIKFNVLNSIRSQEGIYYTRRQTYRFGEDEVKIPNPWARGKAALSVPKAREILNFLLKYAKVDSNREYLTKLITLIENIRFEKITKVEVVHYDGYLYDLTVEKTQNYLAGINGATFIHNTATAWLIHKLAPKASIYMVRALDEEGFGRFSDVIKGIDILVTNVMPDIISLSLGGEGWPFGPLATAVSRAHKRYGIVFVCSSGNSGPDFGTIMEPACSPDCIAVGAVTPKKKITYFSSRGPVEGLNEVKPDVVSYGAGVKVAWLGGYKYADGTSYSAPIVTAMIADVLSLKEIKPDEVENWIEMNAEDLGDPGPDNIYGHGFALARGFSIYPDRKPVREGIAATLSAILSVLSVIFYRLRMR